MKSHFKTYYLDAWIAKDGSVMFTETDAAIMALCRKQILCQYTFRGVRATVVVYSLSECLLRFAALDAAFRFMSGRYRHFDLVTMEWSNGIEH